MIIAEQCFYDCINSPVRHVQGRVELYEGSTLLQTFKKTDALQSFRIERTGEEGKFFGFGIGQKLNVKLVDRERKININTSHSLEAVFGTGCDYTYTNPIFYVSEVHRDENTNELSITAYDALYNASKHTVSELNSELSYSLRSFAQLCAAFLNLPLKIEIPEGDTSFDTYYPTGGNFDGTETIREAMNAIAEATQTIYYINSNWELVFKRLDKDGPAVLNITKDKYFTLDSKTNRRLATITSTTELGDNVISASVSVSGTTQYVRNNPFWELRDDLGELLDAAVAKVGGLTINQFSCSWRGNYLLEIGDKVALTSKNNENIFSYVLNDTITYNGGLIQSTGWDYVESENETIANPSTLGETLKQTYARVDKANKEIILQTSRTDTNEFEISQLKTTTDTINASVERVEKLANDSYESVNNEIDTLTKRVEATMTADAVNLAITNELSKGVDKVITSTGFTFNEQGLIVSKTNSDTTTKINEDGMRVYRGNSEEAVLTANNEGVLAENLKATTYLIIGETSRFEDSEDKKRTCCYWIGG